MIEFLLYSGLSCTDISEIIDRTMQVSSVSIEERVEVVEVLQESTPYCSWDAND